uniref:NADH-ubiquinone oxidoreductase chain 2 n=1 Tax=Phelsuma modesta leiogaster TaxID=502254 RepID=B1PHT0_9SAUR|nr:NADH dehydrogenase subunit 2 [Phelsuma modesta leiogaster]
MAPLVWAFMMTSLATSTIVTLSSHHWLLAWLGLELNTLSMLPIIMKPSHPRATEAATKYFLIQAAAAALIMFSSILNAWQTGQWTITNMLPIPTMIMTLPFSMKLGIAPMHFWYPEVLQGSTMKTALIISTWQKIAPLSLLYLTMMNNPPQMILLTGFCATVIAGVAGLNVTQTRKIMAFSSIGHMGWLIMSIPLNLSLTTLALILYTITTTAMFLTLSSINASTLKDLSQTNLHAPAFMTLMMLTLMSLGGLPPLTGFMIKLLILKALTSAKLALLALFTALSSLPSLFFYLRMNYITSLTSPPKTITSKLKWRFKPNFKAIITPLIMLSIILLPLTPLLQMM